MLVNEDTVYLIFQMDLDTQLQRCLNYEAYDDAQEVRKKRQRVSDLGSSASLRHVQQSCLVEACLEHVSHTASCTGVVAQRNR